MTEFIPLCKLKINLFAESVVSLYFRERIECQLDYFEYCAKEVFDNPETPEDIW